ncbi:3-amino-4-hydroxybenzoic acid synthase [archaeon HR01]|nr:3-amino-4-hydroxybenzoic acid synthase [archaeon HR01]
MRKVIVNLSRWDKRLFEKALSMGFTAFVVPDPKNVEKTEGLALYIPESDRIKLVEKENLVDIPKISIKTPADIEKVVAMARAGAREIHVTTSDWRIIPLENLIAMKAGLETSIIAEADSPADVELLFGILEKGVDGVSVRVGSESDLHLLKDIARAPSMLTLQYATVEEVKDVGLGDRACIDTVTMMGLGEGVLVGSMAGMFFLIHNESVGSSFTSPRPFRVNAGAIHSYILMPDGTTRYLSELSSGDRVLLVDSGGRTRLTSVGRVKIEKRPLRVVKARVDSWLGAATVQNAETIRFISENNRLIPVTELSKGDRILVHTSEQKGRHFGMAVDETVVER